MPIRFVCPHCSQKLSVSSRKAGARVDCPRCKRELTIPAAEVETAPVSAGRTAVTQTEPAEAPLAAEAEPHPFSQFNFDDETELVYDTSDEPIGAPQKTLVDYDRISVPRFVLYLQGGLLGLVGLFSFAIGLIAGSAFLSTPAVGPVAAQPCVVSGAVTYTTGNRTLPDEGAVVVVVPQAEQLDERASVSGLRPTDPTPPPMHRGVEILRTIGGAYARTDDKGRYELRLPDRGRYFVLVISRHAENPSIDQIKTDDLLKMGRYFDAPADLIGKQKYQWVAENNIRGDRKFNAEF